MVVVIYEIMRTHYSSVILVAIVRLYDICTLNVGYLLLLGSMQWSSDTYRCLPPQKENKIVHGIYRDLFAVKLCSATPFSVDTLIVHFSENIAD